jgi:uncharacterized protein
LRAATDVVVPHSHTDVLVAKLNHLSLDETISDSDHSNIPHLVTTQDKIANFLTSQFEAPRAQQVDVQAENLRC